MFTHVYALQPVSANTAFAVCVCAYVCVCVCVCLCVCACVCMGIGCARTWSVRSAMKLVSRRAARVRRARTDRSSRLTCSSSARNTHARARASADADAGRVPATNRTQAELKPRDGGPAIASWKGFQLRRARMRAAYPDSAAKRGTGDGGRGTGDRGTRTKNGVGNVEGWGPHILTPA